MPTYIQKLKEENPELFFDGKGRLLSDRQFFEKLTKGKSKEVKDIVLQRLYSEPEPPPPDPTDEGLTGFAKRLTREVVGGAIPPAAKPRAEEDETVADYIRRTQPGFEKASDTGLARYRSSVLGEAGSIDKVKETLKGSAAEWLAEQDRREQEARAARNPQPVVLEEPSTISRLAGKAYDYAQKVNPYNLGNYRLPTTQEQDTVAAIVDTGLASVGKLAAGTADLFGLGGAQLLDVSAEERAAAEKEAATRRGRARGVAGRGGYGRISKDADKVIEEKFGPDALAARDALLQQTEKVSGAFEVGAEERAKRASAFRSNALGAFQKAIDEADTTEAKVLATHEVMKALATTPEAAFILADSLPSIIGAAATANPLVGIYVGSAGQRFAEEQAGQTQDEKLKNYWDNVASANRGAAADTLFAAAGIKLGKSGVAGAKQGLGQAGLGAVGEVAGDLASNPNASAGQLAAAAVGGLATGPTEVASALATEAKPTIPAEERARLKASPDPLDQAKVAVDEMLPEPPKQEASKAQAKERPAQTDLFGQVTDALDKSGGNVLPADPTETISRPASPELEAEKARVRTLYEQRRKKAEDTEAAYAQRGFELEEESKLKAYDEAVASGDQIAEARAEKALDEFYAKNRPEPTKQQAQQRGPTTPVQQELDLGGGVQPRSTVEAAPQRAEQNSVPLEKKAPPVTPQRVGTKLKQLGTDPKKQFTEAERGVIEQQAQQEGLPPISRASSPRRQFLQLSEQGQNAVARQLVQDDLAPKTKYEVSSTRAKQAAKEPSTVEAPERLSKPVESTTPTQGIPPATKVQQKAPQSVLEASKAPVDVASRIESLPDGRFKQQIQSEIDQGTAPYEAAKKVAADMRAKNASFGKEGRELLDDFALDTDKKIVAERTPLPELDGAPAVVNKARKSGLDVQPAKPPTTKEAKRAQEVANLFGVELNWVTGPFNGAVDKATRKSMINVNAKRPVDVVMGHEANHAIEKGNPEYKSVIDLALGEYANQVGLDKAQAARKKKGYADSKTREEVRSDLLGEALQDPKFFREVRKAAGNRSLYRQIMDFLADTFDVLRGNRGRLDRAGGEISKQVLTDIQGFRQKLLEAAKAELAGKSSSTTSNSTDLDLDVGTTVKDIAKKSVSGEARVALSDSRKALSSAFLTLTRYRGAASKNTASAVTKVAKEGTSMAMEHARIARLIDNARSKYRLTGAELDSAIRGEAILPHKEAQEAINLARAEIDRQSSILASMTGDQKLADTIEANKGTYIHRSYLAFLDNKRWQRMAKSRVGQDGLTAYNRVLGQIETALTIPSDLENTKQQRIDDLAKYWGVKETTDKGKERALAAIRDEQLTPEVQQRRNDLYGKIREDLLDPQADNPTAFSKAMRTALQGSDSILKKREAPQWLREFWGEVQDGGYNFLATAEKQAQLIAKNKAFDQLAAQMLRDGTARTSPAPGFTEVPASASNGPLAGLHLRKEDFDFIHKSTGIINDSMDLASTAYTEWMSKMLSSAGRFNSKANSAFKASTAVYDTSTVAVQVSSSIAVGAIAAGRPPTPAEAKRALVTAVSEVRYNKVGEGARAKVRESIDLGVAGEGIFSSEARRTVRDLLEKDLLIEEGFSPKKLSSKVRNFAHKAGMTFTDAIQFGDTFSRAMVYEIELSRQKEYHSDKSEIQQKQDAAERVRNIMPTYSATAPVARFIASSGYLAPFMTFTWEVHRNILWNSIYAAQDLKNAKNAKQRAGAVGRMGAVAAQMYGIGMVTQMLGNALASAMGEDEDKKVDPADMTHLVRSYHDDNAFLSPIGVDAEGNLRYLAPGRFNAFEPMSNVMAHVIDGDLDKAANSWLESSIGNGFISQIAFDAITYYNTEDKVYADRMQRDIERVLPGWLRRGVLKPARKYSEGKGFDEMEWASEMSGMTVHEVNLNDMAKDALFKYRRALNESKKEAKSGAKEAAAFYDLTGVSTQEDVDEIYREWYENKLEAFQEAYEKLNSIKKYVSVDEALGESGLNKKDRAELLSGKPMPPDIKSSFYEKIQENAINRAAPENREQVRKNWERLKPMFERSQRELTNELRRNK